MKTIQKILLAAFAAVFVLTLPSCKNYGDSPAQETENVSFFRETESPDLTQATGTTKENVPSSVVPEVDSAVVDCYLDTIAAYGQARLDSAAELGYEIEPRDYEYAIRDINADGVAELVIHEIPNEEEGMSGGVIGAIYTLDGDQPVELYFIGRHGSYSITADGYFIYHDHELELEKLVGTELQSVAVGERTDGENDAQIEAAFRAENGISADDMVFDYIPYNG